MSSVEVLRYVTSLAHRMRLLYLENRDTLYSQLTDSQLSVHLARRNGVSKRRGCQVHSSPITLYDKIWFSLKIAGFRLFDVFLHSARAMIIKLADSL